MGATYRHIPDPYATTLLTEAHANVLVAMSLTALEVVQRTPARPHLYRPYVTPESLPRSRAPMPGVLAAVRAHMVADAATAEIERALRESTHSHELMVAPVPVEGAEPAEGDDELAELLAGLEMEELAAA